jgi:phage gpG-like protein
MSAVKMEIRGIDQLERKFFNLSRKVKDRRPLNLMLGTEAFKWIQRNFQLDGKLAGDGRAWTPLKPATIAWKRKRGYRQILRNTGLLRNAWDIVATNKESKVVSRATYASAHDEGTKNIPQRKLIPTSKQFEPIAKKVTVEWMKENIRKARL